MVPALVRLLNDEKKSDIRSRALDALETIGPAATAALPDIVACLEDEQLRSACWGFPRIDPTGATAFSMLQAVSANRKKKTKVRVAALERLRAYAHLPDSIVPWLVDMLGDKEREVRDEAINALECLGSQALPALPQLLLLVENGNGDGTWTTFFQIDPTGVQSIPALTKLLGSKKKNVVTTALEALGQYGKLAASAEPAIMPLLKDKSKPVREQAKETLENIQ